MKQLLASTVQKSKTAPLPHNTYTQLFLKWRIVKQFLNEVDMRQQHSSAAVTL